MRIYDYDVSNWFNKGITWEDLHIEKLGLFASDSKIDLEKLMTADLVIFKGTFFFKVFTHNGTFPAGSVDTSVIEIDRYYEFVMKLEALHNFNLKYENFYNNLCEL